MPNGLESVARILGRLVRVRARNKVLGSVTSRISANMAEAGMAKQAGTARETSWLIDTISGPRLDTEIKRLGEQIGKDMGNLQRKVRGGGDIARTPKAEELATEIGVQTWLPEGSFSRALDVNEKLGQAQGRYELLLRETPQGDSSIAAELVRQFNAEHFAQIHLERIHDEALGFVQGLEGEVDAENALFHIQSEAATAAEEYDKIERALVEPPLNQLENIESLTIDRAIGDILLREPMPPTSLTLRQVLDARVQTFKALSRVKRPR